MTSCYREFNQKSKGNKVKKKEQQQQLTKNNNNQIAKYYFLNPFIFIIGTIFFISGVCN